MTIEVYFSYCFCHTKSNLFSEIHEQPINIFNTAKQSVFVVQGRMTIVVRELYKVLPILFIKLGLKS